MADAVEAVKETATGPGKKWVIVGVVAGLGYLWWTRARTGSASKPAAGAQFTPGGAAVADPIVPPGGDYSPTTGARERPSTNAEWLSQCVDALTAAPYNRPATATWNALNKALAGTPLTNAEMAIVDLAITVRGTPPEGMPPLNMAAPGSPTGTDTTPPAPPKLPAPAGFRDTGPVWQTSLELHWEAVPGAAGYRIADFFTGSTWLDVGATTGTMLNGLVRNGTYYFKIAAKDASGNLGEWSSMLTSHTKV